MDIQGYSFGRTLGWVDLDLVDPPSAQWGMTGRQYSPGDNPGPAAWSADDLTSDALLCHYRQIRQSCHMFLLLSFLCHLAWAG